MISLYYCWLFAHGRVVALLKGSVLSLKVKQQICNTVHSEIRNTHHLSSVTGAPHSLN